MSSQIDNYSRLIGQVEGEKAERTRIRTLITQLIHDTEDCPLYDCEERDWLLAAYRTVLKKMGVEDDQN